MDNVSITNNNADDGLNIKYSNIMIKNSIFAGNYADQFDCDFCVWSVVSSKFHSLWDNIDGDGLDVSGSEVFVSDNEFLWFKDKGISVWENSVIKIFDNKFIENNLGIAIKDLSKVFVKDNIFQDNTIDINAYQKKEIFGWGTLYGLKEELDKLNIQLDKKSEKININTEDF